MLYIEQCANSRAVTIFIRGGQFILYFNEDLPSSRVDFLFRSLNWPGNAVRISLYGNCTDESHFIVKCFFSTFLSDTRFDISLMNCDHL